MDEAALILTDTLATTTEGKPLMFQSKAWAVPHMNMALAVTGLANLGASWNEFLCSFLVARDIDMVDQFAPAQLRKIWDEFQADEDLPTCTVYHFGFRETSNNVVRYTYRSTSNFESELCEQPGFGIKPQPVGDFDDWVDLAKRVRAEQDARPANERVYIGGELFLLVVQNWKTQNIRLHRFDDYENHWLDMNELLSRQPRD
ncbi:hypothetical protein [Actinokineospora inagensis]|uniref:hypothetical protein n=1 Tax=Actinokineospora inagensis TaxID=103730 RepID=UPI0012FAD1F7|nr:hypothetical protein [Actinokineospora inagensis]